MEHIITMDIGTMSMRAILYDMEAKSLFVSTCE